MSFGIIICVKESSLSYFHRVHEPDRENEPYVGFRHLGVTIFGPDKFLHRDKDSHCKNYNDFRL